MLNPEDRVLFIINDRIIEGSTRFQKYGFLLFKQYQKELTELRMSHPGFDFYRDWVPHHFGPYSRQLSLDMQSCIKGGLMSKVLIDRSSRYALTLRGRVRWRKLLAISPDQVTAMSEKVANMQRTSLYGLLRSIYSAYPEYAVNSQIKERLQ